MARKEWSAPRLIRPKANIAVTSGWKRKTGQATQLADRIFSMYLDRRQKQGDGDGRGKLCLFTQIIKPSVKRLQFPHSTKNLHDLFFLPGFIFSFRWHKKGIFCFVLSFRLQRSLVKLVIEGIFMLKAIMFLVITLCNPMEAEVCFGGPYFLHHQDESVSQASK